MALLKLSPNIDFATEFVEYIAGGERVAFRTFDDLGAQRFDARKYFGGVNQFAPELVLQNSRGAGVFWVPNRTDGRGQLDSNIIGVRALFVDLDGAPLQPVVDSPAVPHIIVETSPNKFHCYWLIEEGLAVGDFKKYQVALANKFNGDISVHNPSRVLRLPGFYHVKDLNKPFMVRVTQYNDNLLYDPTDLADILQLDLTERTSNKVVSICDKNRLNVIPIGVRNNTLYSIGAHLRHAGLGYEEMYKILAKKNAELCEVPVTDKEVQVIAKSLSGKKSTVVDFLNQQEPVEKKTIKEKFNILTFAEIEQMEVNPINWVVPDLLPVGLTVLAGDPKAGKSFIAQNLSYAVATGGLVFGKFPTNQGDVLHLGLEDPLGRFKARMLAMQKESGVSPTAGNFTRTWNIMPQGLDDLKLWIDQADNPRLIIIDTLEKFRGQSERKLSGNAYSLDYRDMGAIQKIALENNIGVVVIHHLTKVSVSDPMGKVSGSYGISGAADMVFVFSRSSRDKMSGKLRSMGRDTADAVYDLEWSDDNGVWMCQQYAMNENANQLSDKIMCVFREARGTKFKVSDISDGVGVSRHLAQEELKELIRHELLTVSFENDCCYYQLNEGLFGVKDQEQKESFFSL